MPILSKQKNLRADRLHPYASRPSGALQQLRHIRVIGRKSVAEASMPSPALCPIWSIIAMLPNICPVFACHIFGQAVILGDATPITAEADNQDVLAKLFCFTYI